MALSWGPLGQGRPDLALRQAQPEVTQHHVLGSGRVFSFQE